MGHNHAMADPQHVPDLDRFDRLTVRLYRYGIAMSAVGMLALAGVLAAGLLDRWLLAAELLVLLGAAASIANMHLYDKRVRWLIAASGWVGVCLLVATAATPDALQVWVHHAGLGFVFVVHSAFALKEQFCFKIPGLRLVPALLALSLIPMLLGLGQVAAALLGLAGLVYGALAAAKMRMPLHFDVGNKAAYQV